MKLLRTLATVYITLFLLSFSPTSLHAQTQTTGDIAGTVTDPGGAVVPNAKVNLTDISRGTTQTANSGRNGDYRFSLLNPGPYSISVEASGFQTFTRPVQVSLGQVATADVQLVIGAQTQTVTVTETTPLLQIQNGDTTSNYDQRTVQEIPNSGNDMSFTAELSAGTVANTTGGGLGNFSSLGVGATSNLFTFNGMDDNDPFLNLNNTGATNLMLGNGEVDEVSVVQNAFSPEYGGLAGAQVNITTKSGSNQFHGSATYYWAGRAFDSNNWFNNNSGTPRPFVNANSFAANIGGPVVKNKVFWFFNTEGLYLVVPTTSQAFIPSTQLESAVQANINSQFGAGSAASAFYTKMFNLYNGAPGIASATPLSGGGCDDSIVALNAHQAAVGGTLFADPNDLTSPDPNGSGTAPCVRTIESSISSKTHDRIFAGRMDWNLTNKDQMYMRVQKDHGFQASYTDPINSAFNYDSDQPEYSGQFQWSHEAGSIVNQFTASATWYAAVFGTPSESATLAAFPTTLESSFFSNLGGYDYAFPQGRNVTQYEIGDDVSKSLSSHTIKFGAKFKRDDVTDFDLAQNTSGQLAVQTIDAFYMGGYDPTTLTGVGPTAANPNISELLQAFTSTKEFPVALYNLAFYVQDDWKIKSNLTINYGIRLEHASDPVCQTSCFAEPFTQFTSLDHSASIPYNQAIKTGLKRALPNYTKVQPEPRFSFAYTPKVFGFGATVVRGGIGLFYDAFPGVVVDNFAENTPLENTFTVGTATSPAYLTPGQTCGGSACNLFSAAAASNTALLSGFSGGATLASLSAAVPGFSPPALTSAANSIAAPQLQKWSLGVQQAFGSSMSLNLTYNGNHGIHEPYFNNGLNVFDPTGNFAGFPTAPADPRFNVVTQIGDTGVSNYNGVSATFTKKFSSGSVQLNYTWSHALDMSSNMGNPNVPFESQQFGAGNNAVSYPEDPFNPRKYNYGNADYDVTHYLSANYVWTLPIRAALMGHGWSPLVDGWQVSGVLFARSGLPYTLIDGTSSAAFGSQGYGAQAYLFGLQSGPSKTLNCQTEFPGANVPPQNICLNASNFSRNVDSSGDPLGFGNVTRNQLRGPRYFDTDFTIMKHTKIPKWEAADFGFGFQFFNVFNHPSFQPPDSDVSSTHFGQVLATASAATSVFGSGLGADSSPRIIQLKTQLRF